MSAAGGQPYVDDGDFTLYVGDVRDVLAGLPNESVHCVVTSPPYWGLRDYGTGLWEGGDSNCDHAGKPRRAGLKEPGEGYGKAFRTGDYRDHSAPPLSCACGARRVDRQLGLESTPEEYVANMVAVFRDVRRVLRRDGTCWLNMGDSYAQGHGGSSTEGKGITIRKANRGDAIPHDREDVDVASWSNRDHTPRNIIPGLKPKDLVGIPWKLAQALQEPYYTGRISSERDRVWLAATLDAEGTICGFSHDRKDEDGRTRTGLIFNITNSSEALLAEAMRIWPTALHRHLRPTTSHLGKREMWRWHVNGIENKVALVRELYPYLIVKRAQALLAYNLLVLMADAKRLGHSLQRDAVREKRALLVRLLSDANQGRAFDVPSWCIKPPSLHEQGWYLRADIVWSKPNPMPESVTDRPTKAHEYVFLLTRSPRYFYDQEAVREPHTGSSVVNGQWTGTPAVNRPEWEPNTQGWNKADGKGGGMRTTHREYNPAGRNIRSVWEIATQPCAEAHFATFPEALVERCVKAGTSERGCCPECGAPWERVVERGELVGVDRGGNYNGRTVDAGVKVNPGTPGLAYENHTTGWQPSCSCASGHAASCTVLDPFLGSGTTALVARRLGRRSIGVELSEEYAKLAVKRMKTWYKRPLPPPEPDPAQTALFALPVGGEPRERLPDVDQAPPESVPTNKEKEGRWW